MFFDSSDFVTHWSKVRARGRTRFVLVAGLLQFALPFFLVTMLFSSSPVDWEPVALLFGISSILLGGTLLGAIVWALSERKFRRLSSQPPNEVV